MAELKKPKSEQFKWTDSAINDLRAVFPIAGKHGFIALYPDVPKGSVTKMASMLGIKLEVKIVNGRNSKTNLEVRAKVREKVMELIPDGPLFPSDVAKMVGCTDGVARREMDLMRHEGIIVREMVPHGPFNLRAVYRLHKKTLLDDLFAPFPKFKGEVSRTFSMDKDKPVGGKGLSCGWIRSGLQSAQGMMEMAA